MYTENIREIETLITHYFEGIFYGDVAKLRNCFHDDITIYGDINGNAYLKNVEDYIESVQNRKSPDDLNEVLKMDIIGIDNIGNIAMAKLRVPMLGYTYYDYLSLYKFNNNWKIVNKIFTHKA